MVLGRRERKTNVVFAYWVVPVTFEGRTVKRLGGYEMTKHGSVSNNGDCDTPATNHLQKIVRKKSDVFSTAI